MEASKVTINQALLDNKLGKKGKVRLRTNGVKDLIRSKEAGHLFSYRDLIYAAGYREDQYGTGWAFIKRLIKNNKIKIVDEQPGKRKQAYCVPGDVQTRPGPYGTTIPPEEPKPQEADAPKGLVGNVEVLYSIENIVHNAKQFAWEHNSDSLREFIASMQ